jgi:hypothetical protein
VGLRQGRTGRRRPAARLALLPVVAALAYPAASCGSRDADGEWDGPAARAVARRVAAGHADRPLAVLARAGGQAGPELPWAVRQSLATAGITVLDSAAHAGTGAALLVFEDSRRHGDEWVLDVRVHGGTAMPADQPVADAAGTPLRWRVRCDDGACVATDSLERRAAGGEER